MKDLGAWITIGLIVLGFIVFGVIEAKPWKKEEVDTKGKSTSSKTTQMRPISSSGILISVLLIVLIICEGFNSYQISKLNKIQEQLSECKSVIDDIQYNDPSGYIKKVETQVRNLQFDIDDIKSKVSDIDWNTRMK